MPSASNSMQRGIIRSLRSQLMRMGCSIFFLVVLLALSQLHLHAQAPAAGAGGTLTGTVTDPSGAVIAKASVRLTNSSGTSYDATTNKEGLYEFKNLPPGVYTVKAIAKGFALFTQEDVQIIQAEVKRLDIGLAIRIEEEKVEVTDSTTRVDVNPANNAGMIVISGKDLEALSDDPDELQSELQALAGPSAGPNGGQMYIDGFSAGELPPKASIREIRINQNPFSSEYDKLGYGRIEIFTKPGTDQLHGQFSLSGNTTAFNSRDPFEGTVQPPGYYSTLYSGNLGGPLGKKASFFFNIERRNQNELAVVNTPFLDPATLQITQFSGAFPNPRTRTNVSQRFDFQITPNNTLTTRYQYWRNDETGDGVGGFSLPAMGFNSLSDEHTFQMTDTQVLSPRTINETRFQYIHESSNHNPLNVAPAIFIQGAFSAGGSTGGLYNDLLNRYELQNITYMTLGKHSIKYGGRFRASTENNSSDAKFNGTYVFGSRPDPTVAGCNVPQPPGTCPQLTGLQAYQIMLQAIATGDTPANVANGIAKGGGASFYSLNSNVAGRAVADVTWFDGALFLQDDWRVRPNVTVSTGLRYETQNDLGDHADFAPRVGIAWALGGTAKNKSPKIVLRAGYGIFYDRFGADLVLQQVLQNGIIQQQFQVANPAFFNPNQTTQIQQSSGQPQVIYVPNANLRSPYTMQTGVTLERQLTKSANLSVTYLNSRGVHQFYTNATPPASTAPPAPPILYQYQSGAIYKQNQLIVNTRIQMGTRVSLWGYYTLNYANSDTSGAGYVPSTPCGAPGLTAGTPCGIDEDYGRASFDVRHRVFFGGSIGMPWGLRMSPFMIASSGSPFNITTGQDLYGINVFNARPTAGTCGDPGVKTTPYGCFNLATQAGQTVIPINEATGPGHFTLNLRLSKTFGFGAKKEVTAGGGGQGVTVYGRGPGGGGSGPRGGDRGGGGGAIFGGNPSTKRYNLTFSFNARNVFNNVNVTNPVGNLSSPLFGQSNGLVGGPFSSTTANRRIDLQLLFNF